jgi:nicotinamide-nucleotide amidase
MKAEIVSIGSELTSGQSLDTNSQWLSRELALIGVDVRWHTTLADDLDENVQAFAVARERADLVVITGGLGPTQDDLTRDALALLAGVELVFHEPSFEHIRQLFAARGRAMPERNRVQALFPAGSEPIANAMGTAPGIWMRVGKIGSRRPMSNLPITQPSNLPTFHPSILPRSSSPCPACRRRCMRCSTTT